MDLLHIIPEKTREIQMEKKRKERLLDTFKEREINEKGNNFSYVIDSLRCDIQRTDVCYKLALDVIGKICHIISALNGSLAFFSVNKVVDLTSQENFIQLRDPSEMKECFGKRGIPPELVKQRTPEWHMLRKKAMVTGSTLHKAVGGETLKAQRNMFDERFGHGKKTKSISEEMKRCMDHGTENECNALATFVSTIMPVHFPHHNFYEEGCYFVRMEDGSVVWEVSPDGTIRDQDGNITRVVEFKCPLPLYKYGSSVYYDMPARYIMQLQAEMKATQCSEALLVCWSEESITVFSVPRSKQLQDLAIEETKNVFYGKEKRRPTKHSETACKI